MGSRLWMGLAAATAVFGLTLSGCTASEAPSTAPPAGPVPAAPTTAASSYPPGSPASATAKKVSANTASEAEITAALQAAGVPNPSRWAEEVIEYRPYPADDPNLGRLRQNLAKYNPGQETLEKIISALQP